MRVVIPLAGPDFLRPDGSLKAHHLVDGKPLLRCVLESRPWWLSGLTTAADYIFVLHDTPATRAFAAGDLAAWYPGARTVFLSAYARGAALSSSAGVALASEAPGPLIIDLADILFESDLDPEAAFNDPAVGALAVTFASVLPIYSYLRSSEAGLVVEAAEKRVISDRASAGVYIFRDAATYFAALASNLRAPEAVTFNDLFYVCPVFNGVLAGGAKVTEVPIRSVRDIKIGD